MPKYNNSNASIDVEVRFKSDKKDLDTLVKDTQGLSQDLSEKFFQNGEYMSYVGKGPDSLFPKEVRESLVKEVKGFVAEVTNLSKLTSKSGNVYSDEIEHMFKLGADLNKKVRYMAAQYNLNKQTDLSDLLTDTKSRQRAATIEAYLTRSKELKGLTRSGVVGGVDIQALNNQSVLLNSIVQREHKRYAAAEKQDTLSVDEVSKKISMSSTSALSSALEKTFARQFESGEVRDIAKYFLLSRGNMFSFSDYQKYFTRRLPGNGRQRETVYDVMPEKFASAFNHLASRSEILAAEPENYKIMKKASKDLADFVSQSDMQDYLFKFIEGANLGKRENKTYKFFEGTEAQMGQLAYNALREYVNIKRGIAGFEKDQSKLTSGQKRLVEFNNKRASAILDLMSALNDPNIVIANGYNTEAPPPVPGQSSDRTVIKQSDINKLAYPDQYFAPRTKYNADKNIEYVDLESVKRSNDFVRQAILRKRGEFTDPLVSISRSSFSESLGMFGNGTYGEGRDPITGAIIKMVTPAAIEIDTSDLFTKDKNGKYVFAEGVTEKQKQEISGDMPFLYGSSDKKEQYVTVFNNENVVTAIKKSIKEKIDQADRAAHLPSRWNNFNITGLVNDDYGVTAGQVETVRRLATPSVPFKEFYGLENDPRVAFINTDALYEANGIPKNGENGKGPRVDGLVVIDPGIFNGTSSANKGFAAQLRYSHVNKGMGQGTDFRAADVEAQGIEYDDPKAAIRKIINEADLQRRWAANNIAYEYELNPENEKYGISHWLPMPGGADANDVLMLRQGLVRDFASGVATKVDVKDHTGKLKNITVEGNVISANQDRAAFEKYRKERFVDSFSDQIDALASNTVIKNFDKFMYLPEEDYVAIFGELAKNNDSFKDSYDTYKERVLSLAEVAKRTGGLFDPSKANDRIVQLVAREQQKYASLASELEGGMRLVNTEENFKSEKDFISRQAFLSMGAPKELERLSNENYDKRRRELLTAAGREKHLVKGDSRLRALYEAQGGDFLFSKEVNARAQEYLQMLEHNQFSEKRLLLPDMKITGLATVEPASVLEAMGYNKKRLREAVSLNPDSPLSSIILNNLNNKSVLYSGLHKGERVYSWRSPTSPNTIGNMRVVNDKAISEYMRRLGYSDDSISISPKLHWHHNTGDFDGDTIEMLLANFGNTKVNAAVRKSITDINNGVEKAEQTIIDRETPKDGQIIKENKRKSSETNLFGNLDTLITPGQARLEHIRNNLAKYGLMGAADSIINNAVISNQNDNPADEENRFFAIAEAKRLYDAATVAAKKGNLPEVNGNVLQFLRTRSALKYLQDLGHYEQAGITPAVELIKEKPIAKNQFEAMFTQIYQSQKDILAGRRSADRASLITGLTSLVEDSEFSDVANEATKMYVSLIENQISGLRLTTKEDIEKLKAYIPKLNEEYAVAGSIREKNPEAQEYFDKLGSFISAFQRDIEFLEKDALNAENINEIVEAQHVELTKRKLLEDEAKQEFDVASVDYNRLNDLEQKKADEAEYQKLHTDFYKTESDRNMASVDLAIERNRLAGLESQYKQGEDLIAGYKKKYGSIQRRIIAEQKAVQTGTTMRNPVTDQEMDDYTNLFNAIKEQEEKLSQLSPIIADARTSVAVEEANFKRLDAIYQRHNELQGVTLTQEEEKELTDLQARKKDIEKRYSSTAIKYKNAETDRESIEQIDEMIEFIRDMYLELGQNGGVADQFWEEQMKNIKLENERIKQANEKFRQDNASLGEKDLLKIEDVRKRLARSTAANKESSLIQGLRFGTTNMEHLLSKDFAIEALSESPTSGQSRVKVYDLEGNLLRQMDKKELSESFTEYFGNPDKYIEDFTEQAAKVASRGKFIPMANEAAGLGQSIHKAYEDYVTEFINGTATKSLTDTINQYIKDMNASHTNAKPYFVNTNEHGQVVSIGAPGNPKRSDSMTNRVRNLLYGKDAQGNLTEYGKGNASLIEKYLLGSKDDIVGTEGRFNAMTIDGFEYNAQDKPILAKYKGSYDDSDIQHQIKFDLIKKREENGETIFSFVDYKPRQQGAVESLIQQMNYVGEVFKVASSAAGELNKALDQSGDNLDAVADDIKKNPALMFVKRDQKIGRALLDQSGGFQYQKFELSGLSDSTGEVFRLAEDPSLRPLIELISDTQNNVGNAVNIQRDLANAITSGESIFKYKMPGSDDEQKVDITKLLSAVTDLTNAEALSMRSAKEHIKTVQEKASGEFNTLVQTNPIVSEMLAHKYIQDLETIEGVNKEMYKMEKRYGIVGEIPIYNEFDSARKRIQDTLDDKTIQAALARSSGDNDLINRTNEELAKAQKNKKETEVRIDRDELEAVRSEPLVAIRNLERMRFGDRNSELHNALEYIKAERERFKSYRDSLLMNEKYTEQVKAGEKDAYQASDNNYYRFKNAVAGGAYIASKNNEISFNAEVEKYLEHLSANYERRGALQLNAFSQGMTQTKDPFEAVDNFYEQRHEDLLGYITENSRIEQESIDKMNKTNDAKEKARYERMATIAKRNVSLAQDQMDKIYGNESLSDIVEKRDRDRLKEDISLQNERRIRALKNRRAGRYLRAYYAASDTQENYRIRRDRTIEDYNTQVARQTRNNQRIQEIEKDLEENKVTNVLGSEEVARLNRELTGRKESQGRLSRAVESKSEQMNNAQQDYEIISSQTPALQAAGDVLNNMISRLGYRAFRMAIQSVRQFVTQFSAAMADIQMVTLKTDAEINKLGSDIIKKAIENGATVQEAGKAASALYRQGLSDEEVDSRLESVLKFSKVSNIDSQIATKLGTVAMNSEMASSTQEIFDIVSAISDSAATDAKAITQALQRSIYAAKVSGVSTKELVSMAAAITSNTQLSGTVTGTALSNIFSRMRKIGANDIVYDENGNATSGSSLSTALKRAGIELYQGGKMQSAFDVLRQLGTWWKDNENADVIKNQIATQMGGTGRQASLFLSLMDAFTQVDERGKLVIDTFMEIAEAADGIVDKKMDVWTESLQGSINTFQSSFGQLINSLKLNEVAINVVDALSGMFQALAKVNDVTRLGPLISLLGSLSVISNLASKIKIPGVATLGALAAAHPAAAIAGAAGIAVASANADYFMGSNKKNRQTEEEKLQSDYVNILEAEKTYKRARELQDKADESKTLTGEEQKELNKSLLNLSYLTNFEGSIDSVSEALDQMRTSINNQRDALERQLVNGKMNNFRTAYQDYLSESGLAGITEDEIKIVLKAWDPYQTELENINAFNSSKDPINNATNYGNVLIKFMSALSKEGILPDEYKEYVEGILKSGRTGYGAYLDIMLGNHELYQGLINKVFFNGEENPLEENAFRVTNDWRGYASSWFKDTYDAAQEVKLMSPEDFYVREFEDIVKNMQLNNEEYGIKEGIDLPKTILDIIKKDYYKYLDSIGKTGKGNIGTLLNYVYENPIMRMSTSSIDAYLRNAGNVESINQNYANGVFDESGSIFAEASAYASDWAQKDTTSAYRQMWAVLSSVTANGKEYSAKDLIDKVKDIENEYNRVKENDYQLSQIIKRIETAGESFEENEYEALLQYLLEKGFSIGSYVPIDQQVSVQLADFNKLVKTKNINGLRSTPIANEAAANTLLPIIGKDWGNYDLVKNYGEDTQRFTKELIQAQKYGGTSAYTDVDLAKDAKNLMDGITSTTNYSAKHIETLYSRFKGLSDLLQKIDRKEMIPHELIENLENEIQALIDFGKDAAALQNTDAKKIYQYDIELLRARYGHTDHGVENIRALFGDDVVKSIATMSEDSYKEIITYAEQSVLGGEKYNKQKWAKRLKDQFDAGGVTKVWWDGLSSFEQKLYNEVSGGKLSGYIGDISNVNIPRGTIDAKRQDIYTSLAQALIEGIDVSDIEQILLGVFNVKDNPSSYWNAVSKLSSMTKERSTLDNLAKAIEDGNATYSQYEQMASMLDMTVEQIRNKKYEKIYKDKLENRINKFSESIIKLIEALLPEGMKYTPSMTVSNAIDHMEESIREGVTTMMENAGIDLNQHKIVVDITSIENAIQDLVDKAAESMKSRSSSRNYSIVEDWYKASGGNMGVFKSHINHQRERDDAFRAFIDNSDLGSMLSLHDLKLINDDTLLRFITKSKYGAFGDAADLNSLLSVLMGSGIEGASTWDFGAFYANATNLVSNDSGAFDYIVNLLSNIEGFKELIDVMSKVQSGELVLARDFKAINDSVITFANSAKYSLASALNSTNTVFGNVSNNIKTMNDNTTVAIEEIFKLEDAAYKLANVRLARQKYLSGDRTDETVDIIADATNTNKRVVQSSKTQSIEGKEIVHRLDMIIEAGDISFSDQFALMYQMVVAQGLLELANYDKEHGTHIVETVIIDGAFYEDNFINGLIAVKSNLVNQAQSLSKTAINLNIPVNIVPSVSILDSNGNINANTVLSGAELGLYNIISATAGTPTTKTYSGIGSGVGRSSGGNKGKTASEKLIERLKHGQSLYEHQIKMYNFEETRYQNLDQLTNYGRVLEGEIELEKSFLPVLQDNIQALKDQMNNVTEGGEDWYKLRDALLEAEEKYADITNTIDENNKKLKENQQAILKTHTDLEEMVVAEIEKRIQSQRDMLAGNVDMQENVLKAIKESYEKQWAIIKMDIDRKKKALEEEKALIDERLNKRKSAEDEAAKYEELAKLKAQYASVSMDSSRTKDAAALRKQIQDLEKEIGWDMAEAEAKAMSDAIQDQIDAYDEFASTGDEDLDKLLEDANNFGTEVTRILGMSHDDLMNWLRSNDTEYQNSLGVAQEQILQDWDDTWKKMYGIVDTWWPEVNEILSSETSFINYMTQSIDYTTASLDQQKQMLYQWAEAYRVYMQAYIDTANFSHTDVGTGDWQATEYKGTSGGSGGTGNGSGNSASGSKNATTNAVKDAQKIAEAQRALNDIKAAAGRLFVGDDQIDAITGAGYTTTNIQSAFSGTTTTASSISSTGISGTSSTKPNYSGHGWAFQINKDGKAVAYSNKLYRTKEAATNAALAVKPSGYKYSTKQYEHGGIADFTGPAWLDGTKLKPERILDWQQTKAWDELTDVLSSSALEDLHSALQFMNTWSQFSAVMPKLMSFDSSSLSTPSISQTISDFAINLYEAKLEEDADYDAVAEKVGKLFSKELSKQGFNTRFSY